MIRTLWSEEEVEDLKRYYEEGYKSPEIVEMINEKHHQGRMVRSQQTVKIKASRLNIRSKFYRKEVNGLFYCGRCKEYKEKISFRKNKSTAHGIASICKICETKERINRRRDERYGDIYRKFSEMKLGGLVDE